MGRRKHSRHDTFCREYIIDLNGTRAAIAAGYSEKSAKQQASDLLTRPYIQARLASLLKNRGEKLDLSAERVLSELATLGYSNIEDYIQVNEDGDPQIDLSKLTREQAACIQSITVEEYVEGRGQNARRVKRVKFKLADKIRALELLGRYLKLFVNVIEIPQLSQLPELLEEARKRVIAGNGAPPVVEGPPNPPKLLT